MSRKTRPHVSELTEQPIIGERYLVPSILVSSFHVNRLFWLPVMTPAHDDEELGVHYEHFHFEWRFFNVSARFLRSSEWNRGIVNYNVIDTGRVLKGPQDRLLECVREMPLFPTVPGSVQRELEPKYKDTRLACLRCPHKGIPLNGLPDRGGIVQCPAHGLEWDRNTGKLWASSQSEEPEIEPIPRRQLCRT